MCGKTEAFYSSPASAEEAVEPNALMVNTCELQN